MAGGIEVDLTVEIIDLILLIGYGAIDFQQHIGILAHDGLSSGDDEFIFERFTPGSLDTEVDEFLSGSGINEGRIDGAIGHGLHSERGDGIDSGNDDIGAGDLESRLTGTDGHAVIMGKDGVDVRMKGENGIYEGLGTGLIPIPFNGGHASGGGIGGKGTDKTLMPAAGRRGGGGAPSLEDMRVAPARIDKIFGGRLPEHRIIGGDKHIIDRAGGLTVEDDDLDTGLARLIEDTVEILAIEGGGDYDIDTFGNECADIGALAFGVVVGRLDLKLYIGIEQRLRLHLIVELEAPVVI